ncbi:MAG: P-loop NTPase fold protein [Candidatus Caldarchaeum sp.]
MSNIVYKLPELEIDPARPWASDELGREKDASNLSHLVASIAEAQPFVLCIDSPWGTGKTVFLRMWHADMVLKGYPCVLFNAWETDFAQDPLITLIGEMENYGGGRGEAFENVKKYGLALFSASSLRSNVVARSAKQALESYNEKKSTVLSFRSSLARFVEEVTGKEGRKPPFIFFIDELERCRPAYAIEMLERIKHLFNVPGVATVLALDVEQLSHSARTLYGAGMDVRGYLRRFIDLEYRLPEPPVRRYCEHLARQFGLRGIYGDDMERFGGYLLETFADLAHMLRLSLATINQCFTRMNITLRLLKGDGFYFPEYLAFLTALRQGKPDLYAEFMSGEVEEGFVRQAIERLRGGARFLKSARGKIVAFLVSGALDPKPGQDEVKELEAMIVSHRDEDRQELLDFARLFNSFVNTKKSVGVHDYLVEKLEFTERFEL